jgi:alpha-tubulin suppressor-like RCC1 family protein
MRGWALAMFALCACDRLLNLESVQPPQGHGPWTTVAVGGQHACGIQGDGGLWCWGDNSTSQLGIGSVLEADAPARVGTASWRAVAAGAMFTCGIQTDDSLWCWGDTANGQTGTGQRGIYTRNDRLDSPTYVTPEPTRIEGSWKTITAGTYSACGLRQDDTLWCWGSDNEGQLADPDTSIVRPSPIQVGTTTWKSVSAGAYHVCGIQSDGTLWCWGQGNNGQLGVGTVTSLATSTPEQVAPTGGVAAWRQVDAGGDGACAIADSDAATLYCWGTPTQANVPTMVTVSTAPFDSVEDVAVGGSSDVTSICALRGDRSLWCWGDDSRGQAGPIASNKATLAEPVPFADGAAVWTAVDVGGSTTCAIGGDTALWCAGAGNRGQLANGGGSHRTPTQVPGTWTQVRAGARSTCALDAAGHASCSGSNLYGGIGDGGYVDRAAFVPIAAPTAMTDLAVGVENACAIATDGSAWCWGSNNYCQLGDACALGGKLPTPARLTLGFQPLALAMNDHTCAIDTSHHMWCYGNNTVGQTGTGFLMTTMMPTQLQGAQVWQQVAVGPYHTCATANGGTYCWGSARDGTLGIGTPPAAGYALAPTPVQGTATYTSVTVGDAHSCGIAADMTAYCWGSSDAGQLGVSGLGTELYPTALDGHWARLAAGYYHTCGIQIDGTLWCWGENAYGQLGDGTFESRDAPTPIGDAGAHWVDLTAGAAHTCALRDDSTLWCWGIADSGQLADGTAWSDQLLRVP